MSGTAVLDVRDGQFGYGGHVAAHASVSIVAGEVVALLGPNGSGKTTLMKGMLGLVDRAGGTVELFGRPIEQVRDRSMIGYLPQRQSAAGPIPVTVRELVRSGWRRPLRPAVWSAARSAGDPSAGRPDSVERVLGESISNRPVAVVVEEAIGAVGLAELARRPVSTLSGGQQRRALFARALVGGSRLLLLDEPFAGVDQANQQAIADALVPLIASGATVVVVLHELGPLEPLVTRAICMDAGSVLFDGPIAEAPPRLLHLGHDHDPHGGPDPRHGLGLIG